MYCGSTAGNAQLKSRGRTPHYLTPPLQALLASQLDGRISASYAAIFIPLHLVILTLMASTITRTPGNPCKFGRSDWHLHSAPSVTTKGDVVLWLYHAYHVAVLLYLPYRVVWHSEEFRRLCLGQLSYPARICERVLQDWRPGGASSCRGWPQQAQNYTHNSCTDSWPQAIPLRGYICPRLTGWHICEHSILPMYECCLQTWEWLLSVSLTPIYLSYIWAVLEVIALLTSLFLGLFISCMPT